MIRPVFIAPVPLPQDGLLGEHVFPLEKYGLVRAALEAAGDVSVDEWRVAAPATSDELRLVHTAEYLDDLESLRWSERTLHSELPLDELVVALFRGFTGGTIAACRAAVEGGLAVNIGGGLHHAFADHAEGFCYLNDIAVGIRVLQRDGAIARAAVIDCDVHQGNGTARIFAGDDSVFTFSIHQQDLYPAKERSDLDVGLDDPIGDGLYLAALDAALGVVFALGAPDFVVYQAGADPFEGDRLGNLGLTRAGLAERDRRVLVACAERGIPCAITLGGGYAAETEDTVAIHVATCRAAIRAAPVLAARRATK
jgi:acetoin utilization deacetylase AcuC-like enzyme